MSKPKKLSAKDLANKWGRTLHPRDPDKIAWGCMAKLLEVPGDSKLPLDILRGLVETRDVQGMFRIAESLDPQMYACPAMLLQDRLIVEAFKKYSFVNSPFNKREKAKIRFYEAEALCRATNKRLLMAEFSTFDGASSSKASAPSDHVNWIIHHATRSIADLLGAFRPDEMLGTSRFGPGATLCVGGALTTEYFKYREKCPTVSTGAFAYAEALLNYDRKWLALLSGVHPLDVVGRFNLVSDEVAPELRLTDHNKVTFVPKNAKTERSIAIEPYFNLYFQLGVGGMIRKRLLKKFGIDLTSQKRNQSLAQLGSVDDNIATIDFSMASDTLAIETVRWLLPPDWFNHLDRLRSLDYKMDGKISRYHKFSSMGNGFTFELETLIFAALARGTHSLLGLDKDEVSVFGDDVILSSSAASLFEEVCNYLGFRINNEKSFVKGPFRESCGEDYLRGQRVRPVFCEELDTTQDVVSFANRLSELNRSVDLCNWHDSYLRGVVDYLLENIPSDVRQHVVGPPVESMDTHIHVTEFEQLAASALVKWNSSLFSWEYPVISFHPEKLRRGGPPMALCMYGRLAGHAADVGESYSLFHGEVLDKRSAYFVKMPRDVFRVQTKVYKIAERERFAVTGREVGKLKLGTALRDGLLGVPGQ